MPTTDAVVVGAGPNGLAAAVTLARAGRSVVVFEASDRIGGGTRSEELTLSGVHHDVCSAVHPFGIASPLFRSLPLQEHGLEWIHPRVPLAHGIAREQVVRLPRTLEEAAETLGPGYVDRVRPIVENWAGLERTVFGPVVRFPRRPVTAARFGLEALRSATSVAADLGPIAGPLFAGSAAHAFLPLSRPLTAAVGWLFMAAAHVFGWPLARGGSQSIADALASYLTSMGGTIHTGTPIQSLEDLPPSDLTFFDVTPTTFASIAGDRLPSSYLRRVRRYRYGPAAFKIDYALSSPMPWADPALHDAGTIHLSGTADEVARAERAAFSGQVHPRPFILVAQPTRFDYTRAPSGVHTLWVYAHVPHGSDVDYTPHIEARLDEFAPGFADSVLGRHVTSPAEFEARNPNYVGGDIAGGANTFGQLVFRPFPQRNPYATPLEGMYLCSASTPPGAGVHGMCGYHSVRSAIGSDAVLP